jgi:hypothetical protein
MREARAASGHAAEKLDEVASTVAAAAASLTLVAMVGFGVINGPWVASETGPFIPQQWTCGNRTGMSAGEIRRHGAR